MSDPEPRRYSVVECRVAMHQHYGLVVRAAPRDQPGFVDESAMVDQPHAPPDEWPRVGETLVCVILGRTRDGRLRLSSRPRDVALARAVADVEAALATWRRIRDENTPESVLLDNFLSSDAAVPTLRWALSRPHDSIDHLNASKIVEEMRNRVKRRQVLRE